MMDYRNKANQMKILVTNDDGIFAQGLWVLAKELRNIAPVVVVAPDRELSGTGTAVTLRQPLRVQKVRPVVIGVEAYSVEGTPADSVILALGKLIKSKIDLVVSGINPGPNLGDNVLLSGTVGAALQGYQHGLPAIAISVSAVENHHLDSAAKLAMLFAKRIGSGALPADVFLNINLPDLPLAEIAGIEITEISDRTCIDTIEEGDDGRRKYYWLARRTMNKNAPEKTDVSTIERGYISVTPLHTCLFNRPSLIPDNLCSDLFQELRSMNRG